MVYTQINAPGPMSLRIPRGKHQNYMFGGKALIHEYFCYLKTIIIRLVKQYKHNVSGRAAV